MAEALQQPKCMRVNLFLRLATRTIGVKSSLPELVEDRLGHDRARRVSRAKEQHVERTLRHVQSSHRASGGATGRRFLSYGLWNAARIRVRDARVLFDAHTVVSALAGGEKRLPRNSRSVVDPSFFGLGIAARRLSLLDHGTASLAKTRINVAQFALGFNLNAEMIEAGLLTAGGNGEIYARIVEHPFGVVRFHYRWLRGKQRGVKTDRIRNVLDRDVDMHAFHDDTPL